MKKLFGSWKGSLLALTLGFSFVLNANDVVEADEKSDLDVSRSTFSLTEERTVEVKADFGEDIELEDVEFEFGEKDLSEWKKWSEDEEDFDGEPFINVIEEPKFVDDTTEVQATIEFGLPFDTNDLSNRKIRTEYQQLIDDYELTMINAENGEEATATVELNVYDEFLFYDERKPAIDEIITKSNETNDRYVEYQSLGETTEGRELNFVILAKDKNAVDKYLNETLPTALEDPESLIDKIEDGNMGDYQVPIWFNNMHADEVEGPDAQIALLEKFAVENEVTFDMDEAVMDEEMENDAPFDKEKDITLDVDEVLDDVIFLYAFENNPDGRVVNTRGNANGFDPNRDMAFQTQVEPALIAEEMAKWTPMSYIDMHGYVDGFLIEPTTPPHNPNYEYDLLWNEMVEQAHSMGQAGMGNSNLDSYFMPIFDMESGWDDMNPGYGPSLAMLHGAFSHTVEVPELGQDSYNAMYGVGLGSTYYVTENKDKLYKNQLQIFERGVNGEDDRSVDEYLIDVDREEIGRLRGDNDNFFPDYYVIPEGEDQKSDLEARKMVNYLLRNGVTVEKTTKDTDVNGTMYSEGTYIVPMKQAKRGFVNAVLQDGEDVSDWDDMYDPIIVAFPVLRGFDAQEIREPEAFTHTTEVDESVEIPTGEIDENSQKQVLKNSTNDTIQIVNYLLQEGKIVEKVIETKDEINKGDLVVNTKDLLQYEGDYSFETEPLESSQELKVEQLKLPKVSVNGSSQLEYSVKDLGFNVVDDQADANVIVSDGKEFNPETLSEKSFVGIGSNTLDAVEESNLLPEFDFDITKDNHEGIFKAKVNDHILTSGYQEDELFYTTFGAWITSVPEEGEVLANFSDDDDFYVAGWWPGHEKAQGEVLAFTQKLENTDTDITLFANDLAFRAHTQYSYRLLANSIFDSSTEEIPDEDVEDMIEVFEDLKEAGEFEDDQSARSLKVHLSAVNRYEKKELDEKVVKHLEGFKVLLDHQQKENLISDKAYNILKEGSDNLIEKWE